MYKDNLQRIKALIEKRTATYHANMAAMSKFVKTRWKQTKKRAKAVGAAANKDLESQKAM